MKTLNITKNDAIDLIFNIDNVKYEEINIRASILDFYKNDEQVFSFALGSGFSINKIIETEKVYVDIAIGDIESFFEIGQYNWKLPIFLFNGNLLIELNGVINIVDGISEKKERIVKPWDLLNYKHSRVSKEEKRKRFDICKTCPEFSMGICKQCGCVMGLKTMLQEAKCPLNKW